MEPIGIGALAKRAGVRIDTVRYYERSGLLSPKRPLDSGYRRYGSAEVARLRFIRRAQTLGFTLEEVRELLALSKGRDVAKVKRAADCPILDALGGEGSIHPASENLERGRALARSG